MPTKTKLPDKRMTVEDLRRFIEHKMGQIEEHCERIAEAHRKAMEEIRPLKLLLERRNDVKAEAQLSAEAACQMILSGIAKVCPDCISETQLCSKHDVIDPSIVEDALTTSFMDFYGKLDELQEQISDLEASNDDEFEQHVTRIAALEARLEAQDEADNTPPRAKGKRTTY